MNTVEAQTMLELFSRYEALVIQNRDRLTRLPPRCGPNSLQQLCHEAAVNARNYPLDKLCRWLGFVQGVLAVQGIIDVDTERDYTRPLFHRMYGKTVPTFGTDM